MILYIFLYLIFGIICAISILTFKYCDQNTTVWGDDDPMSCAFIILLWPGVIIVSLLILGVIQMCTISLYLAKKIRKLKGSILCV